MAEAATQRLMRCSFCTKPQTEVKKLIAGPGVSICDECVELCLPLLDGPDTRLDGSILTPEAMDTDHVIKMLKSYDKAFATLDNTMQDFVDILREREVSWAAIGEALGVSRQAAWKRFG